MKKTDIRRLEKVVKKYEEIEKLLDDAYESIWEEKTEYVGGIQTTTFVRDELEAATYNRKWIESRIKQLKEKHETV